MNRAGFGIRVAAVLIDAAIFLPVLFFGIVGARWALESGAIVRTPHREDDVWMSVWVGNTVMLAYSAMEIFWGGTFGKLILRLRITNADGSPAPRRVLAGRWALKHSPRLCGLLDAITGVIVLRRLAAKAGLAIFLSKPLNFITLRTVAELLVLALGAGFFLTLGVSRQALHDRLTSTAVSRKSIPLAKRGFEPVIAVQDRE